MTRVLLYLIVGAQVWCIGTMMVEDLNGNIGGAILIAIWASWPLMLNYYFISRHLKKVVNLSFWKPEVVFLFSCFAVMLAVLIGVNVLATVTIVQHGAMNEAGLIWAVLPIIMAKYGAMIGGVCIIIISLLNKYWNKHPQI